MGFFITFIILIIVIVIIFIFSSKKLSPIPYFPSQPVDLSLIVKALNLKNNQTIIDLGAGDGIVIFKAAKEAFQQGINTKFIAVEINPVLILILYLRRLFHPNKENIMIVYGDMFKFSLSSPPPIGVEGRLRRGSRQNNGLDSPLQGNDIVVYLYISPWYLEKTILNIKNQISKFKTVSYMYPVKSLKNKESAIQGKNKIFIYQ
ncbi:conserved hypothetical protein [Candidatus Roizmanbacteria bacterium]|nr:conserved hypothetical protein [Candidatus Roizmanbacteria bacterium]